MGYLKNDHPRWGVQHGVFALSKRKMTSQATVFIACLSWGNILAVDLLVRFWTHACFKSMHVQLLAVPTVPPGHRRGLLEVEEDQVDATAVP